MKLEILELSAEVNRTNVVAPERFYFSVFVWPVAIACHVRMTSNKDLI
jgi:hypothetical protein